MPQSKALQIVSLAERLGRLMQTETHSAGLLPVQWEVLRYLNKANRFSRTARAVTAYLGLTKGTVSQTLNGLTDKGLVKKQPDSKDRRSVRLSLTAKGRKQLTADPLEDIAKAVATLGTAEQTSLAANLEKVLVESLERRSRQSFGQCKQCVYFERSHPEGSPHYCGLLEVSLDGDDAESICVEQQAKVAS